MSTYAFTHLFVITSDDDEHRKFRENAKGRGEMDFSPLSLESLLPMPSDVDINSLREIAKKQCIEEHPSEEADIAMKIDSLSDEHIWRGEMWGTFYDVHKVYAYSERNPYITECQFSTHRLPPILLFRNIRHRYPSTTFYIDMRFYMRFSHVRFCAWIDDKRNDYTNDSDAKSNMRKRLRRKLAWFAEIL